MKIFLASLAALTLLGSSGLETKTAAAMKELLSSYMNASRETVAIVSETKDLTRHQLETVISGVTTSLIGDRRFIVVERERIDAILKENDLSQSGLTAEARNATIGKLLNAEILCVIGGSDKRITLRLVSVANGSVKSFVSFIAEAEESAVDRLIKRYRAQACPGTTESQKEIQIAALSSVDPKYHEMYLLALINQCQTKIDQDSRKGDVEKIRAELKLETRTVEELEKIFIDRDSAQYQSKAVRKMVVTNLRHSYLEKLPKENPGQKDFYADLYREQLVKMILGIQ